MPGPGRARESNGRDTGDYLLRGRWRGRVWCFPLCSSQGASGFPPKGAATQGTEGSNLHRTRFWRPALCQLELDPYVQLSVLMRNRPPGLLLGAVSAFVAWRLYVAGTLPLAESSLGWHGDACVPRLAAGDQVFNGSSFTVETDSL